ncbi:MAG: HAD-IA family hydrolase [Synergistaceae bacterium]|nr:HAD-IA family hydrolase [Synergistaceae bacterium]
MEIKPPFWHPSVASGVLLDWDGVIADTKLNFSGIRERYYGGRPAMLIEDAETLSEEDKTSLMKDLCDLEIECAKNAVPVPGALELLDRLDSKNIPYCIVSRNCADSISLAAEAIGVKLPAQTWNRDNSRWLKPDPRALVSAAAFMGVEIHGCIFIGDFLYDLQAARRAGIRAVLVQRTEPEWEEWADASYPALSDLLSALDDPQPLVPWEYREIFAKRGEKWLNGAHNLVLAMPDSTSPTLDCWLARAAAFGIQAIAIPSDAVFTPADWKNNPSFDPSSMGRRLADVARDFLAPRFPMVRITTEEEGLKAPKNSLDLMRFIERKIF